MEKIIINKNLENKFLKNIKIINDFNSKILPDPKEEKNRDFIDRLWIFPRVDQLITRGTETVRRWNLFDWIDPSLLNLLRNFRTWVWETIDPSSPKTLTTTGFIEVTEWSNEIALEYMRSAFWETIFILFETLRNSPEFWERIAQYIVGREQDGKWLNDKYTINLDRISQQRPLSPTEEAYIKSIEQLSKFNPYIVALLREARLESYEFLCHHFDSLSERTWDSITDGMYVPQLQVGTGPEWLSYFWEQTRINPNLSAQTLVVDKWEQPWWPFAVPEWESWRLNSSNNVGATIYNLPDTVSETLFKRSVRWYASPFKWYPWERLKANPDIRLGSINIAADFCPTPDMISDSRYANNEDLQLVLAAQAAILIKRICMRTEFVSSQPSGKNIWGWTEKVILRRFLSDGTSEQKTIYTDTIVNASGLWDAWYGFKLSGTRAEKILREKDTINGFPRMNTTLEALQLLSSRRLDTIVPETIVIWGKWDSAAVLIEELAGLFKNRNPIIRNVRKIYIVTDGTLSSRPRYANIRDVLPRGWRWNVVEFIQGRVNDIWYSSENTSKINVYGQNGFRLLDEEGKIVEADAYISATWLSSDIDKRYRWYRVNQRKALNLPSNSQIKVGETLSWNDNILFIGTAADPWFNQEKLAQLPDFSRQALERVWVENAVAIGFRSQDAQASARIKTPKRSSEALSFSDKKITIPAYGDIFNFSIPKSDEDFKQVNNVTSIEELLSSIINYELINSWVILDADRNLDLAIMMTWDTFSVSISTELGISNELKDIFEKIFSNARFQEYVISLLSKYKKRKKNLKLSLVSIAWKLSFKKSYVELG